MQRTVYDRNGQVVRLIHPNEYDRRRLPVHLWRPGPGAHGAQPGRPRAPESNTYDADGRLLQRLDGVGGGVKYEYDLAGDQRRIMTMGGASQELEYDARGLITGIADNNRKQGHEMACSTQN